jgi:CDK-activating kinase assembly factor MAT1
MFEDPMVEKELDIRRRILRDFNKREEDFPTLAEYNDYLENIESIIYNLSNNIDVVETHKRIEQYKRDNKEQIVKNRTKLARNEDELSEILRFEEQKEEERKLELAKIELEAKRKKIRDKELLIDELTYSNSNAKNIIESFASTMQTSKEAKANVTKSQFSTGIKFGSQGNQYYVKVEEDPLYTYVPIRQQTDGPSLPNGRELQARGYISHVRPESQVERAGGFKAHIACQRALQEAMAGLYHDPSQQQAKHSTNDHTNYS